MKKILFIILITLSVLSCGEDVVITRAEKIKAPTSVYYYTFGEFGAFGESEVSITVDGWYDTVSQCNIYGKNPSGGATFINSTSYRQTFFTEEKLFLESDSGIFTKPLFSNYGACFVSYDGYYSDIKWSRDEDGGEWRSSSR